MSRSQRGKKKNAINFSRGLLNLIEKFCNDLEMYTGEKLKGLVVDKDLYNKIAMSLTVLGQYEQDWGWIARLEINGVPIYNDRSIHEQALFDMIESMKKKLLEACE